MKIQLSAMLLIYPFFQTLLFKMVKRLRGKSLSLCHIEINGKISILPKILGSLFWMKPNFQPTALSRLKFTIRVITIKFLTAVFRCFSH